MINIRMYTHQHQPFTWLCFQKGVIHTTHHSPKRKLTFVHCKSVCCVYTVQSALYKTINNEIRTHEQANHEKRDGLRKEQKHTTSRCTSKTK